MEMNRRAFNGMLTALGFASVATAAGRSFASTPAESGTVDVIIKHEPRMAFSPDPVTIKVGETVRWMNPFPIAHTVTFDPQQAVKASNVALPDGVAPFGSEELVADDTFSHTFTVAGTYKYVCKYHEDMGMVGTVIVS